MTLVLKPRCTVTDSSKSYLSVHCSKNFLITLKSARGFRGHFISYKNFKQKTTFNLIDETEIFLCDTN